MGLVIIYWDNQQDFHAEGKERDPQGRKFNMGSVSLGYNESWVQRIERDTMGPVLRRTGVQPHKPGKLRHVSYTTIAVSLHTAVIVV